MSLHIEAFYMRASIPGCLTSPGQCSLGADISHAAQHKLCCSACMLAAVMAWEEPNSNEHAAQLSAMIGCMGCGCACAWGDTCLRYKWLPCCIALLLNATLVLQIHTHIYVFAVAVVVRGVAPCSSTYRRCSSVCSELISCFSSPSAIVDAAATVASAGDTVRKAEILSASRLTPGLRRTSQWSPSIVATSTCPALCCAALCRVVRLSPGGAAGVCSIP